VLGIGEDDPVLGALLDDIPRPRYLGMGTRVGLRRLRDGIPDFVVGSGPLTDEQGGERIASWEREWGLVVPSGNPRDIGGLASLVDEGVRFVNRHRDSGLRGSLEGAIDDLAAERAGNRRDLIEAIDGYEFAVRAHESPARRVADGEAEAGLGLRATADRLDLGFVPLGWEPVVVSVAAGRRDKDGVDDLETAIDERLGDLLASRSGYRA
jgi:putative molybdopterin biosynthesis protein